MKNIVESRRQFLKTAGLATGASLLPLRRGAAQTESLVGRSESVISQADSGAADYTLHIKDSPIEIAPKRIISATTYNGQFPGPLLASRKANKSPSTFTTK